ncbi:MAG: glycoside hydrolase family 43 protein, partial [Epulopiscium sp.]|nr:glycoside hydrolase family 43 protein [Candidatus Epulonipiscium sp.]
VMTEGYRSPGHNSAYYDEDTGRYYLIFHTRFAMKGEAHQVRVHQMFMNEDGWPVIAPYRYAGEILDTYTEEEVIGEYKLIDHGRDISAEIHLSTTIKLQEDGRVVGSRTGTWELKEGNKIIIYLDNKAYKGFFLQQYDTNNKYMVMTFTALNEKDGTAIWGSAVAKNPS